MSTPPLRIGVGGPVGSGKTALLDVLCKRLRDHYQIAVVTNDIYTKEDAAFLIRSQALDAVRYEPQHLDSGESIRYGIKNETICSA